MYYYQKKFGLPSKKWFCIYTSPLNSLKSGNIVGCFDCWAVSGLGGCSSGAYSGPQAAELSACGAWGVAVKVACASYAEAAEAAEDTFADFA